MSDPSIEIAELDAAKRALRKICAAGRDRLTADYRAAAAAAIAGAGLGFASPPPGSVVSAYVAMGSEIDPCPLFEHLAREGSRTCLPVIQPLGNPLRFRAWLPGEPLVARTWGILEPGDGAAEVEPDILLVPLLAFDRRGMRLGYGGGYYDRTLERLRALKPIIAIGLAFAAQELPQVPSARHDQPLDRILTNDGLIDTGAQLTKLG